MGGGVVREERWHTSIFIFDQEAKLSPSSFCPALRSVLSFLRVLGHRHHLNRGRARQVDPYPFLLLRPFLVLIHLRCATLRSAASSAVRLPVPTAPMAVGHTASVRHLRCTALRSAASSAI